MFSLLLFTIIIFITLKSYFTKKREGYMNMHEHISYMIIHIIYLWIFMYIYTYLYIFMNEKLFTEWV